MGDIRSPTQHDSLPNVLRKEKRKKKKKGENLGFSWVCLRHYTSDRACGSFSHSGYISTLSLIGKNIVLIMVHLNPLLMHHVWKI